MGLLLNSLLGGFLALTQPPAEPQSAAPDAVALVQTGGEEAAGQYFSPPPSFDIEPAFDPQGLEQPGVFALAGYLGAVESSLSSCKTMRVQIEALISEQMGSYAVHPDWVKVYQNCLRTRADEVEKLNSAIIATKERFIAGKTGDAAVRAADIIARLTIYHTQVKLGLQEEQRAQQALIAYYNAGGEAGSPQPE